MPIELKKPISYISGLTCENCIHYQEMFPDKITPSRERKYRTDILSKLTTLISELGWMPESGSLEKLAKDVQSTLKVMWEE